MKDRGVRHVVRRHDLSHEPREKYGQKHGAHGHREEVPRVGERQFRIRHRRKEKRRKENVEDDVFRALPEALAEVLSELSLLAEISEQNDEEVGENQENAQHKRTFVGLYAFFRMVLFRPFAIREVACSERSDPPILRRDGFSAYTEKYATLGDGSADYEAGGAKRPAAERVGAGRLLLGFRQASRCIVTLSSPEASMRRSIASASSVFFSGLGPGSSTAIDSTWPVCGNMFMIPAARMCQPPS